jgi:indole-3-acetate monooxygenase
MAAVATDRSDLDPPPAPQGGPEARARGLAPIVRELAVRTEELGTLAPEAVAALRGAGMFSLAVPVGCGGLGADPLTMIRVVETIARADGSSGWTLMANALFAGVAAAYCSDEAVKEIFGGPTAPILAGMLGPGGTAVEVDGGYRGGGRYSFGSGAAHADWLGAGVIVTEDDGRPRTTASGEPEVRVCVVPRSAVELQGNWDAMGLAGTGSIDYTVPERFVAAGFTFDRTATEPERGGPFFRLGVAGFAAAGHTAVALGIAARALEEIALLAVGKRRPGYPGPVAEHPLFRQDFSRHEARYQAARAYVLAVYGQAQDVLGAGGDLSSELRLRFRQSATYAHSVAADVVRCCYTWGGSDSLRNPSPLGRCMRDISGATQHVYVDPITMVDAAPALLDRWARGDPEVRREL